MKSSSQWKLHFTENAKANRIDWQVQARISPEDKKVILYSLKAWQKGETSEGKHLKIAAKRYADYIGDPTYMEVIDLFIKEEQKHGENLGKYIDAIGEDRLRFDLGDQLFRYVRGWNKSITSWTMAVIIIEQAAQIFYTALKEASDCCLLKQICTDILIDESYHIDFQNERIALILGDKKPFWRSQYILVFRLLFEVTYRTIWFAHSSTFLHGGCSKKKFRDRMRFKFAKTMERVHSFSKNELPLTLNS